MTGRPANRKTGRLNQKKGGNLKMYNLRKSKKGFTLIELMVVVMIIGVLVLLGLRAYSSQKQRAMNAIVKANAGTMQTMLVGYMGDFDILTNTGDDTSVEDAIGDPDAFMIENMVNPYNSGVAVYRCSLVNSSGFDDANVAYQGMVDVQINSPNVVFVNGRGNEGELLLIPNALPANKY